MPSDFTEHTIYLVIAKDRKSWWKKSRIVRLTRSEPQLAAGELAVPLQISIPDNLFQTQPAVKILVSGENLIRPKVKVSEG